MADAITYADLRFVKVPLKNSASNHLGQDCEAYEDGELTYENVQVSPVPGGPPGLASAALVDKAGVRSEQPTASWSSVKSSALGRIPRYLQMSQQFQEVTRIWEATNSSLQQQLEEKIHQLGEKEVELQGSREDLISSRKTLQERHKSHEDTEQQLQVCQAEREKTKENLKNEEEQRRDLDRRLTSTQEILRRFFSASSDTCCPCGWIQQEKKCFYISRTPRSLEESQKYCTSLSSKLAAFKESSEYPYRVSLPSSLKALLEDSESYWVQKMSQSGRQQRYGEFNCNKINKRWSSWWRTVSVCTGDHPCICELEAFRFPDEIHLN
ncbi:B-cell differentiation antigen CD72 isoform X2 [Mastomys coucha]|uniref:B-cell differentiation antigen CD72 isoform X2 n=1 Tax=Mastomys coucha TaxID=35658 RepID=UPI001261FE98|nr:B-cell differentiation antigen CD72 isoform X2 [Mastomys coucha]